MDIISAIASINALLIAFFLFIKGKKEVSTRILGVWCLLFSFHFAFPFFFEKRLFFLEFDWGIVWRAVIVSHIPFLFVYTNSLIDKRFKLNFKYLGHFLIVLIFIFANIPILQIPDETRFELVFNTDGIVSEIFLPLISSLFIQITYLIWTTVILVKHQYKIEDEFSYKKTVDLAWIKRIVIGFTIILFLKFIGYGLLSEKIITVYIMDYAIITANIILFFYLVYCGYHQKEIYSGSEIYVEKTNPKKKVVHKKRNNSIAKSEVFKPETNDPITKDLLDLMQKEKLYLQHELSISELAHRLNIHTHTLSKIINDNLEKNFFEFVNDYRITEFKMLASNPKNKHISILGLAMDAGFNSKATFNRIFKNSTGQTPSQFRDNYKF